MMTAASPKGAINKIIKVIPPLSMATPKLRTNAAREEIYIIFMVDACANLLYVLR
jgi:hypothetical protein